MKKNRSHSFQLWAEITNWYLGDCLSELAEIGIDGVNLDWSTLLEGYLGFKPGSEIELSKFLLTRVKELVKNAHRNGLAIHLSLHNSHVSQIQFLIESGITDIRIVQDSAVSLIENLSEVEKQVVRNKG